MCARKLLVLIAGVLLSARVVVADGLLYRYEGSVLPTDPAAAWIDGDPCIDECTQAVADGVFILRWEGGGRIAGYIHTISGPPVIPPQTLWVEWSFSSNQPFIGFTGCDGTFVVDYKNIGEFIGMFGDLAHSFGFIHARGGLEIDEFHTYRFESTDGINYCVTIDGGPFFCDDDQTLGDDTHTLSLLGAGGCRLDLQPTFNRYDFVRYGTLSSGEAIVSSDPPAGMIESAAYSDLDRFTVTYDAPNFVRIDEITVNVSGGDVPVITKTHRPLNSDPQTVEIVLGRPMAVGETTTFTFNDGVATSVVSYTIVSTGACCFADGSCTDGEESECALHGGTFSSNVVCGSVRACCFTNGTCLDLAPACCELAGGSPGPAGIFCDGDPDGDSLDAGCGDRCPSDPFKTAPDQCGCGVPDTDTDGDTVADCIDQCPGEDDTNDVDANGVPDCLRFFPIPTVSAWGLVILTLLLATWAKLVFCPWRSSTKVAGAR